MQASLAVSDSDTAALQCLMTEILAAWERRGRRRRREILMMLMIVMLLVGDPHCYWGLCLECCMTLAAGYKIPAPSVHQIYILVRPTGREIIVISTQIKRKNYQLMTLVFEKVVQTFFVFI